MEVPRRVLQAFVAGLVLLGVAGAATAVHSNLQDLHWQDCIGLERPKPAEPRNDTRQEAPLGPDERAQCRSEQRTLTALDALARATMGPGIAIVVLVGLYLLASAVHSRRG